MLAVLNTPLFCDILFNVSDQFAYAHQVSYTLLSYFVQYNTKLYQTPQYARTNLFYPILYYRTLPSPILSYLILCNTYTCITSYCIHSHRLFFVVAVLYSNLCSLLQVVCVCLFVCFGRNIYRSNIVL